MTTLIKGGTLVNEGRTFHGSLVIEDEKIIQIIEGNTVVGDLESPTAFDEVIDASGVWFPSII